MLLHTQKKELAEISIRIKMLKSNDKQTDTDKLVLNILRENARQIMKQK